MTTPPCICTMQTRFGKISATPDQHCPVAKQVRVTYTYCTETYKKLATVSERVPMTTTSDIEQVLHTALPASMHTCVPALARVLSDARDGHTPLIASPDIIEALRHMHMQGQSLALTSGNMTVHDVNGESIVIGHGASSITIPIADHLIHAQHSQGFVHQARDVHQHFYAADTGTVTHARAPYESPKLIPSLLPYLADRIAQRDDLERAIEQHQLQPTTRPFVCIVHGDEPHQCHDKFLEYVQDKTLRYALHLDAGSVIKKYPLDWPIHIRDVSQLSDSLLRALGRVVLNRTQTSLAKINSFMQTLPGPVLIHTHLYTETLHSQGTDILSHYVHFWNDWPDMLLGQQVLVFLCVHYQPDPTKGVQRWLRPRRYEKLNKKIKHLLDTDSLGCSVLPELASISEVEAKYWARLDEVCHFCKGRNVFDDIDAIYKNYAARPIPMNELAKELSAILTKCVQGVA